MGRELHGSNAGHIGASVSGKTGSGVRAVSSRSNDFEYAFYALSFDGTDDSVGKIADVEQTGSFTVEGWLYQAGPSQTGSSGYGAFLGSGQENRLLIHWGNSGEPLAQLGAGSHYGGIVPGTGKWVHYAYTYDSGTTVATWYVDGVKGSTLTGAVTLNDFYIGRYDIANYFWNGMQADIRIWNVARTQTEIQNNANATLTGNETGLVAYYPTNSGSGTTLVDNAGTNDGTINGATWVERSAFPRI